MNAKTHARSNLYSIGQPAYFPDLGRTSTSQAALKYVSLPEVGFRYILGGMKIHPAFLGAVVDSGPLASRSKMQVAGRECFGKYITRNIVLGDMRDKWHNGAFQSIYSDFPMRPSARAP